MKNKTSFLAIMAIALGVSYANASECIDNDCELSTDIVQEETIESIDVLEPKSYTENIWASDYVAQKDVCEYDYNCPFETPEECEIWYKKPIHKTALNPREPHINPIKIDDIIYAITMGAETSANNAVFEPLVERYKMLVRASHACCTEGILYKLRANGASEKQIYNFLKDDANYYAIGTRCLVMNNNDFTNDYSYGVDSEMVKDVRNACLCKNRKWFNSLLNPFVDIYNRVPEFKSSPFEYKYRDGLNRNMTVSINNDIQNTIGLLNSCPD